MRIVFLVCILFSIFIADCTIVTQLDSNGHGIFSLKNTSIVLRGTNYLRLISTKIHVLFEPDLYSLWDIETALKQMHSYGYNYVRVFLSCPNLSRGFGLSSPGVSINYTMNVVDFLVRAANHEIYVMLTAEWNPANYQSIIDSYPKPANVSGTNYRIFHDGQTAAKAQFFKDLLQEIKNISSIAFQNIFAIDICNEISVSVHEKPFNLTSGIVTFKGISYDMAKGTDRQQLVDTAGNIWLNTTATAIKSIAPTILVTASLFSPNGVGHNGFDGVQTRPLNKDERYPLRPGSLVDSLADYIDLHVYVSNISNADMKGAALPKSKPILMGETGAARAEFSTASSAALAIKNLMIESLNYGFTGWGIWNWDTVEQITRWTLAEQNNTMNNFLSPSAWPIVEPNKTSTLTRKSLI
jgi:hypothetical protein